MVRTRWLVLAVTAALAAAPFALAQGGDDRSAATALVTELERDDAHKNVLADPLRHAHDALERATRMRAAGDEAHARLADGLAREWAEQARDLVRTVDLEKRSVDARREALDAGARAERERALLEEALARAGRLRAQIEEAEHEAKETNRTATQALDGGVMPRRRGVAPDAGKTGGLP